ncbi:MAG: hypothetical protein IKE91_04385 [Clostridia bacterium]|nr:hypothetical protein [Clostridia bacterium]
MDFEDYKTKIQKVSNILENAKDPDDVLNNKDIQFDSDFQYICLNGNTNSDLVNEVIARLAQGENKSIVEENAKNISVSTWKDVFNKNKDIKEIFMNNLKVVIENTGIITYREIESFINDEETRCVVYENIEGIIRKLCTYDRASLIACIRTKENGIETIKKNLELFFKKGEYDISTTYSKILVELSDIPEISRLEILEACSKHLVVMLNRETAVDNETNVLLNWIYDSMEEAQMSDEKRKELQADIDNAIMENFEGILDKTNYDKETIKILKLFSCTHGKFESNRNMFIENSSKLIHMTKIYDLNYEKEKDQEQEKVEDKQEEQKCVEEKSEEEQPAKIEEAKEEIENKEPVEEEKNDKTSFCLEEEFVKEVKTEIATLEEYNELIEQSTDNEQNAEDILNALVKSSLFETDKIIDRVVNKEKQEVTDNTIAWEGIKDAKAIESNNMDDTKEFVRFDFGEAIKQKEKVQEVKEKQEDIVPVAEVKEEVPEAKVVNMEDTQNYNFSRSVKKDKALVIGKEPRTGFDKVLKAVKGFFRKVKKVLAKYKTDRIGD